ncbi:MAG: tetratricopeptide repeat protein [Pseudomonadota bacterium]
MNKYLGVAAIALLLTALSGCISTKESVFTEEYSPEKELNQRVDLARQYIGKGDWENAKRNLRLAYDVDPKNAYVYEAFGLVYQSTGEFELAEDSYERALQIDSNFSRARNNYAAFLFTQQRFEEAEEQLEIVVKDTLYPGRPLAFVNLGLCRVQLFDPEGAEEAFVRALAMDRTNSIALLEMAEIRFNA